MLRKFGHESFATQVDKKLLIQCFTSISYVLCFPAREGCPPPPRYIWVWTHLRCLYSRKKGFSDPSKMAITKAPLLKFCSRKKCLAVLTDTLSTVHFASLMLESSPSNGGIFGEISGNLVFHFRSAASAPAVHHSRDTPNAHGISGSSRDPWYQTPNVRLSTHLLEKDQLCSKWGGFVGAKQSITVSCKNGVLRGRFASGQFLRLQIDHEVHDFCKKL